MDKTMDVVILTAGLSELPLLIAANRFCRMLQAKGYLLPRFYVVCSSDPGSSGSWEKGSRPAAERVYALLQSKWMATPIQWNYITIPDKDAYHFRATFEAVSDLIADPRRVGVRDQVHLDATAGTGAMNLAALDAVRGRPNSTYSYVSVRDHQVFDQSDRTMGSVCDERLEWDLTLQELAELHECEAKLRSADEPTDESINMGRATTAALVTNKDLRKQYDDWAREDEKRKRSGQRRIAPPAELLRSVPNFLPSDNPHECLELTVLFVWQKVLEDLSIESKPLHSVEVRRRNSKVAFDRDRNRFEIDCATVFGYELLFVSCTMSRELAAVKRKAFEVMHRARSVGGRGARGIVVCCLDPQRTREVWKSVVDDLGGQDHSVEIWAYRNEDSLYDDFKQYITALRWGPRE